MLDEGTVLALPGGGRLTVGPLIGEGGQGWVHRVRTGRGESLALKWYRPDIGSAAQYDMVRELTAMPAPSAAFLWPIDLVHQGAGFGFTMPLRPDNFVPVSDLLTGRADAPFSVVVRLCLELADAFLRLHSEGLVYRDISLGNIFGELTHGRVLICDTDNVGVDGAMRSRVLGTSRFMAPEIVAHGAQPSIATDLYALSVLIFYLLMVHHPLVGRRELGHACLDQAADRELFGTRPVFVFDPQDESNRPDPAVHSTVLTYWSIYPQFLRDEFVRAFTIGLREPESRVREGIWRERLSRVLDSLVVCHCGAENPTVAGESVVCWRCGVPTERSIRLEIDHRTLVLHRLSLVYAHHLVRDYDYRTVAARMVRHPDRPDLWGLRNESGNSWRITFPGGAAHQVVPGRTVSLTNGAVIDFGPVAATIRL